jgi:vacuolar-type H+-ATPase subunit H
VYVKSYEDAIGALVACIDDLYARAEVIALDHWEFTGNHSEKNSGWEKRSSLLLSCVREGNHINAKWVDVRWYGQKSQRKMVREAIPRKKDALTYTESALRKHAKDWEIEKVLETEKKLESIRRQAHHIVRAIMSIRSAKKVNRVTPVFDMEGADAGEDDEPESMESEK